MKVANLADIHANIYALNAVLADCKNEAVEHFIVAGDLIGYFYWPKAVVQHLMHDKRVTCIHGKNEDMLAESLESPSAAECYRRKYGSGYSVCRESLCIVANGPDTVVHRNLPSLADLMVRSDMMISAGGTTTWERMCLGLPSIVINIAKNQTATQPIA